MAQKRKLLSSFSLPDLNITPGENDLKGKSQARKRKKFQKRSKGKNVLKDGLSDEDEEELKFKRLQDLVFVNNNKSATGST